jgi:hypothetical protein
MAKPKLLRQVEVRELVEALGDRSQVALVKRLVSGGKWAATSVEFSLVLDDDQIDRLSVFFEENYNVAPFVGL